MPICIGSGSGEGMAGPVGASSAGFPAFACSSGIVGSLVATAFFVTVFSFFASSSDGASLSCSAEFTLSANFVFLRGERRRFGFVSFNVSSSGLG